MPLAVRWLSEYLVDLCEPYLLLRDSHQSVFNFYCRVAVGSVDKVLAGVCTRERKRYMKRSEGCIHYIKGRKWDTSPTGRVELLELVPHTHTETHIVSHQVICPTIASCDELKNEAAQVCSSRSDLVILYCQSHTHL